jgi:hypothetical protein
VVSDKKKKDKWQNDEPHRTTKNNGGMMSKNKFGKSVDVANAYATYRVDNPINNMYFEWKILKTYQKKENEDKNQYARWYTACKSPMTYDSWEYGDAYISEIMSVKPKLLSATDDWKATYENKSG